jgi:hypothetical protein
MSGQGMNSTPGSAEAWIGLWSMVRFVKDGAAIGDFKIATRSNGPVNAPHVTEERGSAGQEAAA